MARYTGASCRQCRRENLKLFLKGDRCFSDKCSIERRAYAPGQHGQSRFRKVSDYAVQLREKQKLRRIYGVLERQFHNYYKLAAKQKGATGENLLRLLETRLDNVVYRMGFAVTRAQARQVVRHNHVLINGKKVNIPSFFVSVGDVITLKEKSKKSQAINESLDAVARRGIPSWLELERDNLQGSVKSMPERHEITMPIQEQLIVELYSK